MANALDAPLAPLVREFRELKSRGAPIVLATIVATRGSTYRKPGAQLLVADGHELRGLLSGGCLEGDLVEHARAIAASGLTRQVEYDMYGEDDRLFGIGSGCEGAMRVQLQRVGPRERWQPLSEIARAVDARSGGALALVVKGSAAGRAWWPGGGDAPWTEPAAVRAAREGAAAGADPRLV
jgi:xanthine/CO dehydrogenase XdhC/CoxF family maturation factor